MGYIVRRLRLMLLTLFGISVLIFVLLRLVPGNIADILFDAAGMSTRREGQIEARARPRPADRGPVRCTGSAACCMAISAIPTFRRSRRWRKSCRAFRSRRSSPALALTFLRAVRRAARRDQRGQAEHRLDYLPARGQPQRPVDAGVLARPADPDGLRRVFGSCPSTSDPQVSGTLDLLACRRGGRFSQLGADHAAHALVDAGSAAAGLHPHRARQGRHRRVGQLSPRAGNAMLPVVTVIGIEAAS